MPKSVKHTRSLRYGGTLLKRGDSDWIVLTAMSTRGNAGGVWALAALTATDPAGPYTAPNLLLCAVAFLSFVLFYRLLLRLQVKVLLLRARARLACEDERTTISARTDFIVPPSLTLFHALPSS